ncbi:hypothetical protein DH2020_032402 [Rehmannia glutinosa]|uniref:Uncharacterized protein n=1 Tax=Rehmannia glutinosa TaxID=99300 RepID=A0ABR0VG03_REHGL
MAGDSSEPTRQHRSSRADDAEELSKRRKHRDHQHRRRHHRHRSKQDEKETRTKSQEELDGKKVEEVEVEEINLENYGDAGGGATGEVMVSSSLRIAGVDYDMEEGEIVEDDGLVDYRTCDFEKAKKNLESDVESGEIETNGYDNSNMKTLMISMTNVLLLFYSSTGSYREEHVERVGKNLRNLGKDSEDGKESGEMDWEKPSTSGGLAKGDYAHNYHKDDDGFLDGGGKRKRDSDAEVEQRSFVI